MRRSGAIDMDDDADIAVVNNSNNNNNNNNNNDDDNTDDDNIEDDLPDKDDDDIVSNNPKHHSESATSTPVDLDPNYNNPQMEKDSETNPVNLRETQMDAKGNHAINNNEEEDVDDGEVDLQQTPKHINANNNNNNEEEDIGDDEVDSTPTIGRNSDFSESYSEDDYKYKVDSAPNIKGTFVNSAFSAEERCKDEDVEGKGGNGATAGFGGHNRIRWFVLRGLSQF